MGRTPDAAARLAEALDRLEGTLASASPPPASEAVAERLDRLEAAVDDALALLSPYLDSSDG